jgi:hypothetical protein
LKVKLEPKNFSWKNTLAYFCHRISDDKKVLLQFEVNVIKHFPSITVAADEISLIFNTIPILSIKARVNNFSWTNTLAYFCRKGQ